ncbi:MAG: 50S ribosomal protein L9 [Alphaproteobacteria bacterium]
MEIILLERIVRLGQMGDVVRVRDGYARNYLLPQGKALRANDANRQRYESERAQIEARNLERRTEASDVGERIAGQSFIIVRQAGETGQLYGSVTTRDLAEIMEAGGFMVTRSQIALQHPIKTIGMHVVPIDLHAEVTVPVTVNIARSEDEAARQAAGEDVTRPGDEPDEDVAVEAADDEADAADDEDAASGDTEAAAGDAADDADDKAAEGA